MRRRAARPRMARRASEPAAIALGAARRAPAGHPRARDAARRAALARSRRRRRRPRRRPAGARRCVRVEVDLDELGVGPISSPCCVVQWLSEAPNARMTSACGSSSAASGEAKPPEMPSAHGVAGEEAVGDRRRSRARRRARSASASSGARGAGENGAAAGDDDGPRRLANRAAARRCPPVTGAGATRVRLGDRRAEPGAGCAWMSIGMLSTTGRRSSSARRQRPGGVGCGRCGAVDPLRHRSHRRRQPVLVDPEVRGERSGGCVAGSAPAAACATWPLRRAPSSRSSGPVPGARCTRRPDRSPAPSRRPSSPRPRAGRRRAPPATTILCW